ncbi:2-keto-3-deoxy-galactonokinase [Superficieibacter electus]|uniref:2-keto-3-deoxy-galactonokinase n=1 Tax=Superficieibacter electus TaxID=2022662 RepID=A0A2P5GS99_9ENTR|nr:2-dehydro-3-deoxygalactonokinase [Superficieibacter electus]POP46680.1 2-keto-3-deoxy-galactonokinase [Superficieibacter electus]POP49418.1 2-keto-3-deoxy-galactonokinase [Superficieibacter electus]
MNYIAVDWGTSNFRAMRVRDGEVTRIVQDTCGVGKCQRERLPAILREQLLRLGEAWDEHLPVLLCGMIGSNIGIADAGYQELPLSFRALTGKGQPLEGILPNPLTLRPGICDRRNNEICRGEEMQLAGALTLSDSTTFAAVGTHSKWMTVDRQQQRVDSLQTLMTGELYHLVLNHSVVGKGLPAQMASPAAFLDGVATAQAIARQEKALVSELFRCRGRYILGELESSAAGSWLSGLLIGHEILTGHPRNAPVCFIGSPELLSHYRKACEALNLACMTLEAETALVAGLNEVFRHDH